MLSSVLFFVILTVFPIYVGLFPPNQAYAVFGVFLVFTFWLYLLGFVFVLGAELNAFLQEPRARSPSPRRRATPSKATPPSSANPARSKPQARGSAPSTPLERARTDSCSRRPRPSSRASEPQPGRPCPGLHRPADRRRRAPQQRARDATASPLEGRGRRRRVRGARAVLLAPRETPAESQPGHVPPLVAHELGHARP